MASPPAALPAAAAAGAAAASPKTTPPAPPAPPPPPPLDPAASLRAQHWPADPALHPAAHTPLAVRLEGRALTVEGLDAPLLSGLSPLAFVSHDGGNGNGNGGSGGGASSDHGLVLGFDSAAAAPTPSEDIPLGTLPPGTRFLAGARSKLWWMFPAWGSRGAAVPPETQFLLCQLGPGVYAVLTPLIDGGAFRGTLRAAR